MAGEAAKACLADDKAAEIKPRVLKMAPEKAREKDAEEGRTGNESISHFKADRRSAG